MKNYRRPEAVTILNAHKHVIEQGASSPERSIYRRPSICARLRRVIQPTWNRYRLEILAGIGAMIMELFCIYLFLYQLYKHGW